jgi:hypothetical protein
MLPTYKNPHSQILSWRAAMVIIIDQHSNLKAAFFLNWWNLSKAKTKNENLKIFSRFSFSRCPQTEVRK